MTLGRAERDVNEEGEVLCFLAAIASIELVGRTDFEKEKLQICLKKKI